MSHTTEEIMQLEEQLRLAELKPDPDFFARVLDDDALLDGQKMKPMVVEAHRPDKGQKFTRVEMSDFNIVDHGNAAVLTCKGTYETAKGLFTMSFMRVWLKTAQGWKIIAGTTKQ